MHPIIYLLVELIDLYNLVLLVWIILSLLIYFKIINAYQPFVQKLNYVLYRLTEPVLAPIRKYVPPIGGLDLSPLVLIFGLHFIRYTLIYYF